MSRLDAQQGLMPSVLDRLIDQESAGTSWRRGYGIEQNPLYVDAAVREQLIGERITAVKRARVPVGVSTETENHADMFLYSP